MDGIKAAGLSALQAYAGTGAKPQSLAETGGAGIAQAANTIGTNGQASGFGDLVSQAIESVQEQGQKTQQVSNAVVNGQGDLIDVVTAIAETEVALETMVSVRDKVISAYEEIMRMPI